MDKKGNISIILVFVDDLIFVSSIESILMSEVTKFLSLFEGTEEELQWYFGVHIAFSNGILILSQRAYFENVLDQFKLQHCKTYTTPIISN